MDFTEAYSDRCSTAGHAARSGNIKCLRRLIKNGCSIDVPDNRGWMPIHEAAYHNSSKCLGLLIKSAPAKTYIKSKTFEGETALHLSARRGGVESTQILLKAGADPNEVTNEETTPLFIAVENKHADVVQLLIQHGAKINGSHSFSGWNALHQASCEGSIDIMKLLLEQGVDTEFQDDFGITPLFVAAQYGKVESVRLLLAHGANVNCQAKDKATPLFITSQEGHIGCAELLLSEGADPNLFCNEDSWQLPIHVAAQMGHTKILELLVRVTDRICYTGEGKVSPVYTAVYGAKTECLEILLKEGYSPDAHTSMIFGCSSPMCMVFQTENFEVVPILLKYGVRLTGLHLGLCLDNEKFSMFRQFLERGCPLPTGKHLQEFKQYATNLQQQFKEWLPYLLLAGFNPLELLHNFWISSVNDDTLNFTLEFTNWKRLAPAVGHILSAHAESSTWVPQKHFGSLPSLSHHCRLEIRRLLGSEQLRSDKYIRQLPLPTCLQDFLLYMETLTTYGIA